MLPSLHDDNISCILLALQGYKNKTVGCAARVIFISLHGDFLSYSKISCKLLISNGEICKKNSPKWLKTKTSEQKIT